MFAYPDYFHYIGATGHTGKITLGDDDQVTITHSAAPLQFLDYLHVCLL